MIGLLFLPFVFSAEICGDGICNGGENKDNCVVDCGTIGANRSIGLTYHTKNATIEMFTTLCNEHPSFCSYEVIGHSLLNKNITMFKFGNPNGGIVIMDGNGHGPEDCGTEISYTFAKWMMESNDADAIRAKTNNYFMVIPVLNIDTYNRQNMRRNYTLSNGSIINISYGVDLNRNAPIGWGGSGSGNISNNYEYRGLSGASEPEMQAIVSAMQRYNPDVYVNTHCGMFLRSYYPMNNITSAIINRTATLAIERNISLSRYPATAGCSGGHICRTGGTYGKSGWIIEVAEWSYLPVTVEEYNTIFYPKMHIVWLGMLQAVEKIIKNKSIHTQASIVKKFQKAYKRN
jgi:hypothetical protein